MVDTRRLGIHQGHPSAVDCQQFLDQRVGQRRRTGGLAQHSRRKQVIAAGPDVEVDAPTGFTAETVARGDERLGRTGAPEDRVAAQTWASAEAATVVTLEKGVVAERPAVVRVTGRGGLHYLQLVLRAETQSAGVVVLDHRGAGTLAANVEVDLDDAAQLTVVSVQDWADDAVHVTAHSARA